MGRDPGRRGALRKWQATVAGAAPGALGIPRQDVTFRSADGVRLAGWYVPPHNGAAILVVHGGGANRASGGLHARMLARHGYGMLLYDERGRGESQGAPDAARWTWQDDVAGALQWLKHRPDVDPRRIGGLGMSTGAEALVQAAAQRRDLHAIVADGVEGRISRPRASPDRSTTCTGPACTAPTTC
jgi:dipeptidyl aminopeptidase/acylaminoacyl peptidase